MEFKIITLVDITESGERRGPDRVAVGQQSNWDTLIQVVGLRVNPTPKSVIKKEELISGIGFGSQYKGKQAYWEFVFELEYGSTSVESLTEDFDLVPVVLDLTETAKIDPSAFQTKNSKFKNIIFIKVDK